MALTGFSDPEALLAKLGVRTTGKGLPLPQCKSHSIRCGNPLDVINDEYFHRQFLRS